MRDSEILQVKTAARLLSGRRDEIEVRSTIKRPEPDYTIISSEREAEQA